MHLSPDAAAARRVGARHGGAGGRAIVLRVDAAGMAAAGAVFTRSANGVWLVDAVPPAFLSPADRPGTGTSAGRGQTGPVIRNVVVGRVRPGTDLSLVQEALDAIVALPVEGLVDVRVGLDAGLRPGAWSFAITSDFVDADAYRVYDAEAEHNRIRREMFDPVCEEIARVQFQV